MGGAKNPPRYLRGHPFAAFPYTLGSAGGHGLPVRELIWMVDRHDMPARQVIRGVSRHISTVRHRIGAVSGRNATARWKIRSVDEGNGGARGRIRVARVRSGGVDRRNWTVSGLSGCVRRVGAAARRWRRVEAGRRCVAGRLSGCGVFKDSPCNQPGMSGLSKTITPPPCSSIAQSAFAQLYWLYENLQRNDAAASSNGLTTIRATSTVSPLFSV